jgi:hypothetical protein
MVGGTTNFKGVMDDPLFFSGYALNQPEVSMLTNAFFGLPPFQPNYLRAPILAQ